MCDLCARECFNVSEEVVSTSVLGVCFVRKSNRFLTHTYMYTSAAALLEAQMFEGPLIPARGPIIPRLSDHRHAAWVSAGALGCSK